MDFISLRHRVVSMNVASHPLRSDENTFTRLAFSSKPTLWSSLHRYLYILYHCENLF